MSKRPKLKLNIRNKNVKQTQDKLLSLITKFGNGKYHPIAKQTSFKHLTKNSEKYLQQQEF